MTTATDAPLRVLLSDTWAGGGASTFVAAMSRELHRRGHYVDVIMGYRTSPAVAAYEPYVGRVFDPPNSFVSIAISGKYDVIHMTEADLAPPFAYARRIRRLGLPTTTVATSHTAQNTINCDADVLVFVSEEARASARFTAPRDEVIPNGVDAEAVRQAADDSLVRHVAGPLAVWSGRLIENPPQKDFLGFAYAIRALLRAGWSVLVVDGSPPDPIAPAAEQLRRWFGDKVMYANQIPAPLMLGALQHAGRTGGALVSTSRVEAAPFVALESLALSCPIVAPPIAAYRHFIDAGMATGYDDLEGLIEVLTQRAFAAAEVVLPAKFTASSMVSSYLELYRMPPGTSDPRKVERVRRAMMRGAANPRLAPAVKAARSLRGRPG